MRAHIEAFEQNVFNVRVKNFFLWISENANIVDECINYHSPLLLSPHVTRLDHGKSIKRLKDIFFPMKLNFHMQFARVFSPIQKKRIFIRRSSGEMWWWKKKTTSHGELKKSRISCDETHSEEMKMTTTMPFRSEWEMTNVGSLEVFRSLRSLKLSTLVSHIKHLIPNANLYTSGGQASRFSFSRHRRTLLAAAATLHRDFWTFLFTFHSCWII